MASHRWIDFDRYKILGRISSGIVRKGKLLFLGSLEVLFETCENVSQIFLTYKSSSEELIAIIVPKNMQNTTEEIYSGLIDYCKERNLSIHEYPSRVVKDSTIWTIENGLLTAQLIARKAILMKHQLDST